MNIDKAVLRFAGCMIILSLLLTQFVDGRFIYFTAFIGLNMIQASFTGFCPAAIIFKKFGCKSGQAFC